MKHLKKILTHGFIGLSSSLLFSKYYNSTVLLQPIKQGKQGKLDEYIYFILY